MGLAVLAPRRGDVCFVDIHQQFVPPTDLIQVSSSPSNFSLVKSRLLGGRTDGMDKK